MLRKRTVSLNWHQAVMLNLPKTSHFLKLMYMLYFLRMLSLEQCQVSIGTKKVSAKLFTAHGIPWNTQGAIQHYTFRSSILWCQYNFDLRNAFEFRVMANDSHRRIAPRLKPALRSGSLEDGSVPVGFVLRIWKDRSIQILYITILQPVSYSNNNYPIK